MAVIIELQNLNKMFDDGDEMVLEDINLKVEEGEFLTLLGPSGCGKTTMLRIMGGFETPSEGKVIFNGKDITKLPPYERNINTVFQKYALFPHLNVYDNIAFGLRIKKVDEKIIEEKVNDALKLVNLKGFAKRKIDKLSGGQQQRIAIARALVNEPKILLLDEPLGALDLKLRKEMQIELKQIQKRVGITFVFVTHDQEEALTMSDKIVVLNNGHIQQIGTPVDIYNEPINAFVADFIGESNIIKGKMLEDFKVNFLGRDFVCVDKGFEENEDIEIVIRPEDIVLRSKDKGMLNGIVESLVFMGVHYEMQIRAEGFSFLVHSTRFAEVGAEVGLEIDADSIHIMRVSENEI